jgi:hypothetical protein
MLRSRSIITEVSLSLSDANACISSRYCWGMDNFVWRHQGRLVVQKALVKKCSYCISYWFIQIGLAVPGH